MRLFFKSPKTGEVFEYASKLERDQWGAADLVQLTAEETKALLAEKPKTQDQINAEARAYLADTDWYVIRAQETGEPLPDDVSEKRKEARASVVEK